MGEYGTPVWYLSSGPHCDDIGDTCPANAKRYALDFMPPTSPSGACSDERIHSGWVTAAAPGEVHYAGDNLVEIDHGNGFRTGYYHLVDIQVIRGGFVVAGDKLGRPSCEVSAKFGGHNFGVHVHFYICQMVPNPNPALDYCGPIATSPAALPIEGKVISGWTVHAAPRNHDGTMTKPGQLYRTAEAMQCGIDDGCQKDANGNRIRNDLPPNLLKNSSFELADNNGKISAWDTSSNFRRSTGTAQIKPMIGAFVGLFPSTNNSTVTINQAVNDLTIDNSAPGTIYTFRGWINIPPTHNTFKFLIQVGWYGAGGNAIRTDIVRGFTADTGGTWIQAAKTMVAPLGTTKAVISMIGTAPKTTIYVDNFLFHPE
jgi:hypothetical protein